MTQIISKLNQLKKDVRFLHEARLDIRRHQSKIQKLETRLSKYPEASKINKINQLLVESKKEEAKLKDELKESGLNYWESDECPKRSGKRIFGGTIADTKVHNYNEAEVLIWAEKNFQAAVIRTVTIDAGALKSIATAQHKAGDITIPSYTIEEVPVFKIAKDLTKYQGVDSDLSKHVEAKGE